ncbi:hypothetical protein F4780DRAFT_744409 [Xylariomycetidae sp. FL0641]|nr:hypothetical protein F4780DRAFT_744409 [Xylariomycetidae sp. FL0641]
MDSSSSSSSSSASSSSSPALSPLPATSACVATCRTVNGDLGDWIVDFAEDPDPATDPDYRHFMVATACPFSVGRVQGEATSSFRMTNFDIDFLVGNAVQRFGDEGADTPMAANGTMTCDGVAAKWFVGWPIET